MIPMAICLLLWVAVQQEGRETLLNSNSGRLTNVKTQLELKAYPTLRTWAAFR